MYENINIINYSHQFVEPNIPHILVDVRTTSEYMGGHLPNAINIPLDQLGMRVAEIPSGQPVIVVCASGNRSQTGAMILKRVGFQAVYNLEGGTMGWMLQGRQIVR